MLAKVTAHNAEPLNITFTEAKTSLTILGGGSILVDLNATEEANIRATLQAQAETVSSIKETTGSVRPVVVDPAPPEGSKKARLIEEAEALGVDTRALDYSDLTREIGVARAVRDERVGPAPRDVSARANTETTSSVEDDEDESEASDEEEDEPAKPASDESEDLDDLTVTQLKERAKARGIPGFNNMNKAALIDALEE